MPMNPQSFPRESPLERSGPLPEPELEPATASTDKASAPVVVVQHRGHWTRHLLPPALILATAGWIHALRPEAPPWPEADRIAARQTSDAAESSTPIPAPAAPIPASVSAPAPAVADVPDARGPLPDPQPDPPAPALPKPKPKREPVPLGFRPLGDIDDAEPRPEPDGDAQAVRDLRRELERRERREERALADGRPVRDQAPGAGGPQEMARTLRDEFHRKLRHLLAQRDLPRDRMAREIQLLRTAHLFDVTDEVRKAAGRVLTDSGARRGPSQSSAQIVKSLRRLGVPEPVVLEFLFSREVKTVGSRSGPRDVHDAWIKAARDLLAES